MAWIQYAPSSRYDPDTGAVQVKPKGKDWQNVATTRYDPNSGVWKNTQVTDPSGLGQLPDENFLRQVYLTQQMGAGGGGTAATGAPSAATGARPSYLGAAPQISMGTAGTSGWAAGGAGADWGGGGAGAGGAAAATGGGGRPNMATVVQFTGNQIAGGTDDTTLYRYDPATGITSRIINGQIVGTVAKGESPTWDKTVQDAIRLGIAQPAQPEITAASQMGQIDPASEALRQRLAQSYLTPLQQAGQPTAAQFQSNLDIYRQLDPTGAAAREKLGSDLAAQEALGTQLDPATQREVEQATRRAQEARGNVYGTPQLVQEAMTRGQAGLALQQQRQQALQSYLSSGQTTGDVAMNLYNQQQQQLRASQGAAVGYLGSGQTPYQAGASYLNTAEQRAAAAAPGGPQYSPQALGMGYSGAGSPSFPQYGLDMSQLAGNWYNNINQANLQAYGLQQAYGQRGGSAAKAGVGALSGAATGALTGAAAGGVGAIPGAIIGGIGGAASGYFS